MFWLFRRKKVADKKAITPCVCDNGTPLQGAFTLREFASTLDRCLTPRSTSDGALSRLTFTDSCRSVRKGYHRLQGEGVPEEPQPPVPPPPQQTTRLPPSEPESTSSPSSTDYSDCDPDLMGNSDSDDDEELTCNVCDRSFRTLRHLEQHQQRKRHYGCSICDSIFPNLMALELHKETLDHWSEDELRLRNTDSDDDSLDDDVRRPEELERLL